MFGTSFGLGVRNMLGVRRMPNVRPMPFFEAMTIKTRTVETMTIKKLTIEAMTIAAMAVALAGSALAAPVGQRAITCTNPASGTQWQIKIDYDNSTVDSNPAQISEGDISWHDPSDGGNYTLDRKSGNLTVVVASSTGGYFLYDRCKLDN